MSRRQAALAAAGPALLAVLARLATGPHPVDDAYITFRYARNLADGLGLVYNPGEWVLGTTAPLWAVLLAGARRLGGVDLPTAASSLAALCDGGSAALLTLLALGLGWRWWSAALVGTAWALNPMSVAFAVGGMETSLFVLVVLLALSLAAARRPTPAAAVAGVGVLVRPEALLVAAVVVGWAWSTRRRPGRLPLGPPLAAALPALLAAALLVAWYGSPLPHTVAAKQVAYHSPPWLNLAGLLLPAGLPGWSSYLLASLPGPAALLLALAGAATLAYAARLALPWLHQRGLAWQPFAAFAALYALFYVVAGLRGTRLFPWYLVPLIPCYLLVAAAALAAATGRRAPWLVALLVLWQLPAIDHQLPFLPAGASRWREALYLEVGRELGRTLPPGAVVAAPEIGALGYASGLRVLDTVGLVSPAALPYYPLPDEQLVADNAIPPRLIDDLAPDAVVALDEFVRRSLLPDPGFQRRYRLERSYPAPRWASEELLLFRRAD